MKAIFIALIAAALLALGSIAAACGGDDKLTLEEYFERFEAIEADADAKFDVLYEDIPDEADEEFFSNEENLPLLKELFAGFPVLIREVLDQVEELNPPSEAEDPNDELLATGREWLELLEDSADRVEAAESISEVEQIEEELEPAQGAAQERFDAACLALEGIADDNGIVVDFDCDE